MWYAICSWIDKFHIATERQDSSGETEKKFNMVGFQTN